jgi:hypothetical protein
MMPTKAPAGTLCQPHRERAGIAVPATVVVSGSGMCRACFNGESSPRLFAQKPVAQRSDGAKGFGYRLNRWPVPPGNPPQRKPNKGQWAMAVARLHPECGISGTGHRDPGLERSRGKFSQAYLYWARVVLRSDPELADAVSNGTTTLTAAYRIVQKKLLGDLRVSDSPSVQVEGTKAQKAMALAMRFPGYTGGRDGEERKYIASGGFCTRIFRLARLVLRNSPKLAHAVLRGEISLNAARQEARRLRMLESAGRFRMPYLRPVSRPW